MSNTGITGRVPLWLVGTVVGTLAIGLVAIFFYGSYVGLGSSLSIKYFYAAYLSACNVCFGRSIFSFGSRCTRHFCFSRRLVSKQKSSSIWDWNLVSLGICCRNFEFVCSLIYSYIELNFSSLFFTFTKTLRGDKCKNLSVVL